jgi:hypothetical protein
MVRASSPSRNVILIRGTGFAREYPWRPRAEDPSMIAVLVTAIFVMLIGLALGAVMTRSARRMAEARGDAETAARLTLTGTPAQRQRQLWLAAALSVGAVVAAAAGATGVVTLLVTLSLAIAGQAAVLQLLARRRDRDAASGDGTLQGS